MQKVTSKLWPGYLDHSRGVDPFQLPVATIALPTEGVTSPWGAGGEGRGGQAPPPRRGRRADVRRRAAAGRAWQRSPLPAPDAARRGEVAGCTMRPVDSARATELQEPGLQLTEDTPPGASEEPTATEEVGTPDPHSGWCWLCRSSPCCSRAQPGECGVWTLALVLPLGDRSGASTGILAAVGAGALRTATTYFTLPRAVENPGAVTWGQQSRIPSTCRCEDWRKFPIVFGTL